MPKKDGFADAKKEADKAKKAVAARKSADDKVAKATAAEVTAAADAPRTASSTSAGRNGKKFLGASTGTTFAKAAAQAVGEGEEVEEATTAAEDYTEDYDYDVEETNAASAASAPSKAKKETKESLKIKEKARKKNEFAHLDEEERIAKKQRIKDRFLRMLVVGVIMEWWKGEADTNGHNGNDKKKAPNSKETKKTKKSQTNGNEESSFTATSLKEKFDQFSGPCMLLVVILAMLYGKSMEDSYSPNFDASVDFYEVMGVAPGASVMDVRKKYKSLALTWHPDKNPDCEACPEKFAAISKAYETLSDVEAKKAYDSKSAAKETLTSAYSVDLGAEDFEAKVLRSNEVWYVEVYNPSDHVSPQFHPIWEEITSTYQHVARFGRIDASKNKKTLEHLPHRIVITPIIFRFARGEEPQEWVWRGNSEESGTAALTRFVVDNYPAMHKAENADELTRWWKQTDRSRLLIAGGAGVMRQGAKNKQFFQVLREAHLWSDDFAVISAEGKDAVEAAKAFQVTLPEPDQKKGHPWSVIYIPAGETSAKAQITSTTDLKALPAKIEEVVQKAVMAEAPHLTVRNHRQLCGAGSASRTFCLVLVDMTSKTQIDKVLSDVAASRAEYSQELKENREAEGSEAVEEEPFRIQAVRVMTGTSRFPSQPVAVTNDFYTMWAEVKYAPMFLVELETQRVSAVKDTIISQLAQQIAYEDIKFKECPEDFHLIRALPDPEVPLKRALFRKLSSPIGASIAFVLLAAITAVAPELEFVTNVAAGCSGLAFFVAVWPLACRKFLSATMLF